MCSEAAWHRGATDPLQTSLSSLLWYPIELPPKALHNCHGSLASNCWTFTSLCLSVLMCKMGVASSWVCSLACVEVYACIHVYVDACAYVCRGQKPTSRVCIFLYHSPSCVLNILGITLIYCVCVCVCMHMCAHACSHAGTSASACTRSCFSPCTMWDSEILPQVIGLEGKCFSLTILLASHYFWRQGLSLKPEAQ